jgi:hypothetical protein
MRELQEEEAEGEHHNPCIPIECAPPTVDYLRMVDGIFDNIVNCEGHVSTSLTRQVVIEREGCPCAKITPSATDSAPATHVRRYVFSIT